MHVIRIKLDINLYPIVDICSLIIKSLFKIFLKVVPSTIKNHLRILVSEPGVDVSMNSEITTVTPTIELRNTVQNTDENTHPRINTNLVLGFINHQGQRVRLTSNQVRQLVYRNRNIIDTADEIDFDDQPLSD